MEGRWACLQTPQNNTIKTVKYGGGLTVVWGRLSANGTGNISVIDDRNECRSIAKYFVRKLNDFC